MFPKKARIKYVFPDSDAFPMSEGAIPVRRVMVPQVQELTDPEWWAMNFSVFWRNCELELAVAHSFQMRPWWWKLTMLRIYKLRRKCKNMWWNIRYRGGA